MPIAAPSFTIATPFHLLGVTVVDERVTSVRMLEESLQLSPTSAAERAAAAELEAYCRDPHHTWRVPLLLRGTQFQIRVWQHLQTIPPGSVQTYGSIAASLGTSARAVGNACRRNPLLLIVPCHRVVAAGGWGGFSGTRVGRLLDVKRALLAHEGISHVSSGDTCGGPPPPSSPTTAFP